MSKIRKSAEGEQCTLRLPGICNHNQETTVLCHIDTYGMGGKCNDIHAVYGCSECHKMIDGGYVYSGYSREQIKAYILDALIETQSIMIEKGLIKIGGGR